MRRSADDVRRDGLGADEETAAERNPERRRRARVDRADPLPRALDAPAHRASNTPPPETSRHAKAGAVEDLRDAETSPVGIAPQAAPARGSERGVDQLRHGTTLLASRIPQERNPAA
jgi:hypothetical protein